LFLSSAPNENDPSGEPIGHGECCAGIIAASHNYLGIRGISPRASIIPINIFNDWYISSGEVYYSEDARDLSNAIDFAWDDAGADVLSNSWGYRTAASGDIPYADAIIAAIGRARSQGRNGLGSIVVFASGNYGGSFSGVTFPANVNGVITVGAVDKNGNIWNYSSRGSEMDLVAPSGNTDLNGDIRTIDREGTKGYESGNYTEKFGGTSAACPQVSGVAALMLSVNPSLTEPDVRTILQQTATDMGSTGFDNTYGYGRGNAAAAVRSVYPIMTGTTNICSSGNSFSISNLPAGATITWSQGPNLTRTSAQGANPCTFSSTGSGNSWVKATITTGCGDIAFPQWNVYSGVPNPNDITITNIGPFYPGSNQICTDMPNDGILGWNNNGTILEYGWDAGSWQVQPHPMDPLEEIPMQFVQIIPPQGTSFGTSVRIRARNQCGWGPYSAPAIVLSGTTCR